MDDCFIKVREAFKDDPTVTNADIQSLIDDLKALKENTTSEGFIAEATRLKGEQIKKAEGDALKYSATIEKYKINREDSALAKNPRYYLEAKLGGAAENFEGSNLSVHRYKEQNRSNWQNSLSKTVDDLGLGDPKIIHDPKMSRDIRIEMFELSNNSLSTKSATGNDAAFHVAKGMSGIIKDMRNQYVRLGVPLSQVENYIGWQRYDREKIVAAGEPVFIKDLLLNADHSKTFPPNFSEAQKFARAKEMYTHITKGEGVDVTKNRSIHYADGAKTDDMMTKYGMFPSAVDSIRAQTGYTARIHGLMEVFGPDFEQGYNKLRDHVFSKEDAGSIANKVGSADQMFAEATGKTSSGADTAWARTLQSTRDFTSATLLGGSSISALAPDLAASAALLHTVNGAGYLNNLSDILTGYVKNAGNIKEQKAFMRAAGIMAEDFIHNLHDAMDGSMDVPGVASQMAATVFKWNGMNAHDRAIKTTIVKTFGERLNRLSHLEFEKLPDMAQYNMGRYKIGSAEWDVIRQAKFEHGGTHALMPSAILDNPGINFNGLDPREVYLKYSSYMGDIADLSTLKGDAVTRATLNLGTSEDGVVGQLLRFMGQFKASPMQAARLTKRIAMSNPAFAGKAGGDMVSVATYAGFAMAAGYLTYAAKEFVKGNSIPDPSRIETIAEAATKGGFLGTMGDFATAPYNMSYRNIIADLAGPVAGKVATAAKLGAAAVRYDFKNGKFEIAAHKTELADFVTQQIPGNNIWWAKMASEHLFLDAIHEYIKPGHTWKQDSRLKARGQERVFPSLGVPNDNTLLGGE